MATAFLVIALPMGLAYLALRVIAGKIGGRWR